MPGHIRKPTGARAAPSTTSRQSPAKKSTLPVRSDQNKKPIPLSKPDNKKRTSPDTSTSPRANKKVRAVAPPQAQTRALAPPLANALPTFPPRGPETTRVLPANENDYMWDKSGMLPSLMEKFNLVTMQIISSSKMSAKIARSLDSLVGKINLADINCKPNLVVLYAKAPTASKLVSIVEVVKRTVAEGDGRWWQYSVLGQAMQVIPRKVIKPAETKAGAKRSDADMIDVDGDIDIGMESDDDEDSYFETMKTKQERLIEGTDRVRAVPVLAIYLSRVPVEKLKNVYGEQTNAKKETDGGQRLG